MATEIWKPISMAIFILRETARESKGKTKIISRVIKWQERKTANKYNKILIIIGNQENVISYHNELYLYVCIKLAEIN